MQVSFYRKLPVMCRTLSLLSVSWLELYTVYFMAKHYAIIRQYGGLVSIVRLLMWGGVSIYAGTKDEDNISNPALLDAKLKYKFTCFCLVGCDYVFSASAVSCSDRGIRFRMRKTNWSSQICLPQNISCALPQTFWQTDFQGMFTAQSWICSAVSMTSLLPQWAMVLQELKA